LSLFLTHQYIDQLHEKIRSAIFGNVGTIISFRVGAEDAEYLTKEFYPVFEKEDFVHLPKYSMYLKLMIDGMTSKPFSATSIELKEKVESHKEEVISASIKKVWQGRKEVEKLIFQKREENESEMQQGLF